MYLQNICHLKVSDSVLVYISQYAQAWLMFHVVPNCDLLEPKTTFIIMSS